MAAILNPAIMDSPIFHKKGLHSFILTQLHDGRHLEFGHLELSHLSFSSQTHSHLTILVLTICTKKTSFIQSHSTWWWQPSWILASSIQPFCTKKNCTYSFWLNLMMAAILNSAIFDSVMLHKTLTQSNSIWLKLIHSDSTWWWQPSWILPCWIQTLPSWIQMVCYLLSDSLKNTLPLFWLCPKLIQSD